MDEAKNGSDRRLGYPQFSFWIWITLVKICFSRIFIKPRKNTFELVGIVLKGNLYSNNKYVLTTGQNVYNQKLLERFPKESVCIRKNKFHQRLFYRPHEQNMIWAVIYRSRGGLSANQKEG